MKKLYKMFLVGIMSLMLAACGNDKTNDDAISVEEETEEEVVAKEEVVTKEEKEAEEELVTEEVAVEEETKVTEYQLTQMNSGFSGGIAWATVADDTGAKKVLINKDLQVVYELPEGMETGDIFEGKAVVIHSDQASNPGFMILGADGTVLYECSDNLVGYNINFTRDGSTIYEKKESGLTANTAYACILNDKFETVAQIEIPEGDEPRFYFYLSDGVYGAEEHYSQQTSNYGTFILNAKENNAVVFASLDDYNEIRVCMDMDRCAGFQLFRGDPHDNLSLTFVNAEALDYSGITDTETLRNMVVAIGKSYNNVSYDNYIGLIDEYHQDDFSGTGIAFNHGFVEYTVQDGGIEDIEGVVLPDFGAKIKNFRLSTDGKYVALQFEGADGNQYYTSISSDGQKMYDPITLEQLYDGTYRFSWCEAWGVCDGYIMGRSGNGITPDGKVFQLGDGTALSGIGENSLLYSEGVDQNYGFRLSDGYIVCQNKLYQLDGTEIATVTAAN